MAKTRTKKHNPPSADSGGARIDSPHKISQQARKPDAKEASAKDPSTQVADLLAEGNSARIANQAIQLAEHLQQRQRDLDELEAKLNLAVAQLEDEKRQTGLASDQRQRELARREAIVQQREAELATRSDRSQRLAAEQAELHRRQDAEHRRRLAETEEKRTELAMLENTLSQRESALAVARRKLDDQRTGQLREVRYEQQQLQQKTVKLMQMRRRLLTNLERNQQPRQAKSVESVQTKQLDDHRKQLRDASKQLRDERSGFQRWRNQERQQLRENAQRLTRKEAGAGAPVAEETRRIDAPGSRHCGVPRAGGWNSSRDFGDSARHSATMVTNQR